MEKLVEFKNYINLDPHEIRQVYEMRTNPEINKWMKNKNKFSYDNHLNFIEKLKKDNINKYYLVKVNGIPIGSYDITNIDRDKHCATCGSYFLKKYHKETAPVMLLSANILNSLGITNVYSYIEKNNIKALIFSTMKLGGEIIKEDANYLYLQYSINFKALAKNKILKGYKLGAPK